MNGEKAKDVDVKDLRRRCGKTQEQFGSMLGVTFTTVNRWENGHNKPSPLARRRIEELLGQQGVEQRREAIDAEH